MEVLPKHLSRYKAISVKILADIFGETDKLLLKFICKCKRPRIPKIIFKTKNQFRRFILPDFKIHYLATLINEVCYCPRMHMQIKGIKLII